MAQSYTSILRCVADIKKKRKIYLKKIKLINVYYVSF